jgi:heme/copper-type cytochrome/quinol oxidase subunit 2
MRKYFSLLLLVPLRFLAQCAMCTSTVDLAVDKKNQVGHGFNHSIAFMLGVMTLLLGLLVPYIAWRFRRAARETLQGEDSVLP